MIVVVKQKQMPKKFEKLARQPGARYRTVGVPGHPDEYRHVVIGEGGHSAVGEVHHKKKDKKSSKRRA